MFIINTVEEPNYGVLFRNYKYITFYLGYVISNFF